MKKRSRTYLVPASLLLALLLTLPAAGPFPARAAEAPAVLVFVNWTDVIFPQARAEVIARIRENTPLCPEEDALLSRKEAPYIVTEAELQYSEEGITAVCAGNGTPLCGLMAVEGKGIYLISPRTETLFCGFFPDDPGSRFFSTVECPALGLSLGRLVTGRALWIGGSWYELDENGFALPADAGDPAPFIAAGFPEGLPEKTEETRVPSLCPGHAFRLISARQASCTEEGELLHECARCGHLSRTTLPRAGHKGPMVSKQVTRPAGCVQPGAVETVIYCMSCGKTVHVHQDAVLPAAGHAFDDGRVITQPAAGQPGLIEYTCTRCREKRTETLPPLGG